MRLKSPPYLALLYLALAVVVGCTPALGQNSYNPYAEPETSLFRPSKGIDPPGPAKPLLEPMEGGIPGSADTARAPPQEPLQATPSTPYQAYTPAGAAEDSGDPQGPDPQTFGAPILPPATASQREREVQRADLEPVMAAGGPDLPYELWRGMSAAEVEGLFAQLEIPPRSPALHELWRRLIIPDVAPPTGGENGDRFSALRIEALDRSGLNGPARELAAMAAQQPNGGGPLLKLLLARLEIGHGNRDRGCENAKAVAGAGEGIPKLMKAEAIVMTGYCVAAAGNAQGAGIAAELARENGLETSAGLSALDAIAVGAKPDTGNAKGITLAEFRMLELAGVNVDRTLIGHAAPGLLTYLAQDTARDASIRLAAGEAAVRLNAILPSELREIYHAQPLQQPSEALASDATGSKTGPALRRASLLIAAESERTPQKKTRLIRSFLDDARRNGLYWAALSMMAEPARTVTPIPEVGWFAETAIEIALVGADYDRARIWARFAASPDRPSGDLRHWIALADIVDPKLTGERSSNLASIERMALDGRFDPVLLHRFATTLDALDTHIPVPLWEASSRAAQPSGGHLPESGVLSALLAASKNKEFSRTVLLAMKTLGPEGAEGAHMIALGDSIRALKRAGLETDARRLALEALFGAWPRSLSN